MSDNKKYELIQAEIAFNLQQIAHLLRGDLVWTFVIRKPNSPEAYVVYGTDFTLHEAIENHIKEGHADEK